LKGSTPEIGNTTLGAAMPGPVMTAADVGFHERLNWRVSLGGPSRLAGSRAATRQ